MNVMNRKDPLCGYVIIGVVAFSAFASGNVGELERRATWTIPDYDQVSGQIGSWLHSRPLAGEAADQVAKLWSGERNLSSSELLDRVTESFALADNAARELVAFCQRPKSSYRLPDFAVLTDARQPEFVRDNLRLLYGRWLANHELYNEALDQLGNLQPADVVDPSSLLFYQSVAYHRLLMRDACLPVVERLMEHEQRIPQRYASVARLIQADIEPLKEDSLDEISRLMDSIQVRLGHGRAGARVRKEEDDVIAKLDKMIDDAEQNQSQSSQSSGAQGGGNPQSPMPDSMPGGGSGPGNVDAKKLDGHADWGNLPPKEREEAHQELGKDFPSHYRDVIEEYFRKLARDGLQP